MIRPLAEHEARDWLRDLVDLYDRGQCEPLPLPVKTSLAYAEELPLRARPAATPTPTSRPPRVGDAALQRLRLPREDADPWHVRAFGEHAPYALLAAPAARRTRPDPAPAPARRTTPGGCGSRCSSDGHEQVEGRCDRWHLRHPRPTCRPAPPCWRRAPAPARRGPSPRSSPSYVAAGEATPRRDARGHLHPRRQPGAARAGARPARRGRRGARPTPTAATASPTDLHDLAARRRRRRARAGGRAGSRDALVSFDAATIATIHQFCQLVLRSLGRRRRHRRRRHPGRGPRRSCTDRGRRRPLPRPLRRRSDDAAVVARRGAAARPRGRRRPAGRGRARAGARRGARLRGRRAGRGSPSTCSPRSTAASAAWASSATTTCSAQLADALADDDAPARRADAAPLEGRADRRVPGHRPGAVAGLRPGLHRRRDDGAHRRPQAGHLRLPRRRHRDLPRGPPRPRRTTADPRRQLALRRGRCSTRCRPLLARRRRSATSGSWSTRSRRHHQELPARGGRRAVPAARGAPRRARRGTARQGSTVGRWRDHVIADVARDIKRLLLSGADLRRARRCGPGDVAVLAARRSRAAGRPAGAGRASGCPRSISAGGTVFHTPAATEWLTLLEALEQPHRTDRVRGAGAHLVLRRTPPPTSTRAATTLTDRLADRVRTLADVFTARGVAAVLEATVVDGLTARVLGRVGGERTLTDLRHIGESLHQVVGRRAARPRRAAGLAARAGGRRARSRSPPSAPAASTPTPRRSSW